MSKGLTEKTETSEKEEQQCRPSEGVEVKKKTKWTDVRGKEKVRLLFVNGGDAKRNLVCIRLKGTDNTP